MLIKAVELNGQSTSGYPKLAALYGSTLPDMRGRLAMHAGTGPGLSTRRLGTKGGSESETLTVNQLPSHHHSVHATNASGTSSMPVGGFAKNTTSSDVYIDNSTQPTLLNSNSMTDVGGSRNHSNLMPALCINYIIALIGIYPSRN